jgi:gamma-glutamylcyclotransferase (GGCT)/AIG2-like uncharacterized protein YtfP
MTPKKAIVRKPTYTLLDGSSIPIIGKEFNKKENAFIYWYTSPGSEAFMNAGRAAVRAGYKPGNAVIYGYQLRQKLEISKAIDSILGQTKERMQELLYHIAFLSRDRMFFKITDFYRQVKKPVKNPYKIKLPDGTWEERTWEYDFEAIPFNEISEKNRMCIDNITYKGMDNKLFYILPDRDKAFETFLNCCKVLYGKDFLFKVMNGTFSDRTNDETNWRKAAEFLRENGESPVIAPRDGKAPKNAVEAL